MEFSTVMDDNDYKEKWTFCSQESQIKTVKAEMPNSRRRSIRDLASNINIGMLDQEEFSQVSGQQ